MKKTIRGDTKVMKSKIKKTGDETIQEERPKKETTEVKEKTRGENRIMENEKTKIKESDEKAKTKELKEEKHKEKVKKDKKKLKNAKVYSRRFAIRLIALIMAFIMIAAVVASLVLYLKYYNS